MAKKIIVAKFTHEGKEFVGKRETKLYDESTKMEGIALKHANDGLKLQVQRQVRDAVKERHGIKAVTSGGASVDLSNVEAV
jgi:hypothetical protein